MPQDDVSLNKALENMEKELILKAFSKHKTTVGVAESLGISQPTAARKIRKYMEFNCE